jgi:hypothetical protein
MGHLIEVKSLSSFLPGSAAHDLSWARRHVYLGLNPRRADLGNLLSPRW